MWCLWLPRAVFSSVVGLVLGVIPAVVLAAAWIAITIVRLPINLYATFKVALRSVILRPGLRFVAGANLKLRLRIVDMRTYHRVIILLGLPLVHVLSLPILVLAGIVLSLGTFVGSYVLNAFNCDSLLESVYDWGPRFCPYKIETPDSTPNETELESGEGKPEERFWDLFADACA